MARMDHTIEAGELGRNMVLEVHITGMRQFRFRLGLVRILLRIVSWIAPINVDVKQDNG